MPITHINGVPFYSSKKKDKISFGSLFPHGLQPPNFKSNLPGINANAGSALYKYASPFADHKWQQLKRDTQDIHKTFFPFARIQAANKVIVAKDPDVTFDLTEKDFTLTNYFEKNGIEGYQEGEDTFVSRYAIRVFISTDGKKVEHAAFECQQPNDNEICFFIEDNTNDWSKAKLYALFGKSVKKDILSQLPETNILKKYLLVIPGITPEVIQELIDKGVVVQSNGVIKTIVVGITDLFCSISLVSGGIGWFADTLGDAVLNYLSLPESVWNVDSDNYFLKKENLIESLTISNETIAKIEQALFQSKNTPALKGLSAFFIGDYTLKSTNVITTYIERYNAYVIKQINQLYEKYETTVIAADQLYQISEFVSFLCGVWNGLVDFVGGTLKFIGMIFKTPYEVTFNLENTLETFDNFCYAMDQVWEHIGDTFSDAFKKAKDYFKTQNGEDINSDKVAYAIGFGLAFIGTFFIPFTQLAKVANFSKIGKALLPAKYLEEIGISSEKAVNFITDKSKRAFDAASKIIDDIINLLAKGKQALSEFLENIGKRIVDWFLEAKKQAKALAEKIKRLFYKETKTEEVFRKISKKINLAGEEFLSIQELKKLRQLLRDTFKVSLEIVDQNPLLKSKLRDWEIRRVAGSFNMVEGVMYLRKNVTAYTVQHEMYHMKLWYKMTKEFPEMTELFNKTLGIENRLFHEEYVLAEFIRNPSKWKEIDLLNDLEFINSRLRKPKGLKEVDLEHYKKWNLEEELLKFN